MVGSDPVVSYGKSFQGVEERAGIFSHSGGVGKGWGGALVCGSLLSWMSNGLMVVL